MVVAEIYKKASNGKNKNFLVLNHYY
jgi:hypothetical protein